MLESNVLKSCLYLFSLESTVLKICHYLVQFGEYRYSAERMTWDPNCYECKVRYRDPKPKDLVMYLHAWVYKVIICQISLIGNICGTNTKKPTGIDFFLAKSLFKSDFFPVMNPFLNVVSPMSAFPKKQLYNE